MSWDTGGDSWGGNASAPAMFNDAAKDEYNESVNALEHGGSVGSRGRGCFNCGEEGHLKSDCPNPAVERAFTGACRICEQEGHRAADCPTAPPKLCNNCQGEGHAAIDCENPRKPLHVEVPDVPADQAWEEMKKASEERDLDDFKEACKKYLKATPDCTFVELEQAFRSQDFGVYLIALEKEIMPTYTNMDAQGYLGKKYTISYRLSPTHQRPKEKEMWPTSAEENITRLADAGEPVDRGIPKCGNCEELGHIRKHCPQEIMENTDRAIVQCYNCEGVGHRVRDCPNPRPDKFACRNCQQSGHTSKECPEPRSAEGVECKKCSEIGHFSRDCPQGGGGGGACHNCGEEGHRSKECTNPKKIICRNCDEEGHTGRECPKPRDYSRVECSNCHEKGHTKVRCKQPIVEDGENDGNGYGGYSGASNNETGGFNDGNGGLADDFSALAIGGGGSGGGGDSWGGAGGGGGGGGGEW